jgi:hypothetical protein
MSDNLPQHYDKSKVGIPANYNPVDPKTGKLRSLAEMQESALRARRGAKIASAIAKREADAKRTPNETRLQQAQAALKDAKFSGDKARIELWMTQVVELSELVVNDAAKAKRDAEFAADPRIKIIRDLAEGMKRSGSHIYPTTDTVELETLIAIATSDEWPTPQAQYEAFNELLSAVEDREIAAEKAKSEAAGMEAAKHSVTQAKADIKVAELEQSRARRQVTDEQ